MATAAGTVVVVDGVVAVMLGMVVDTVPEVAVAVVVDAVVVVVQMCAQAQMHTSIA